MCALFLLIFGLFIIFYLLGFDVIIHIVEVVIAYVKEYFVFFYEWYEIMICGKILENNKIYFGKIIITKRQLGVKEIELKQEMLKEGLKMLLKITRRNEYPKPAWKKQEETKFKT